MIPAIKPMMITQRMCIAGLAKILIGRIHRSNVRTKPVTNATCTAQFPGVNGAHLDERPLTTILRNLSETCAAGSRTRTRS